MRCCNLCTGPAEKTTCVCPVLSVPLSRIFSLHNERDTGRRSQTFYFPHLVLHFHKIAFHLHYFALYIPQHLLHIEVVFFGTYTDEQLV